MNIKLTLKTTFTFLLCMTLMHLSFAQTESEQSSEQVADSTTVEPDDEYEAMDDKDFDKIINPELAEEDKKPKRIVFALKVTDEKTKANLPAYVELKAIDDNGKIFKGEGYCNSKGIFKLNLMANARVKVTISYGTYMPVSDMFNIVDLVENHGKEQVKKLYKLSMVNEGEYVNLDKITFAQGQSKLETKSFRQLDELALMMITNPDMEIEIAGHTDDTGSPAASQKLSEERVTSVKQYLVEKKEIKEKRIHEVGYGSTKPIAKGTDPASREKNRRVEFKILTL